MLKGDRAGRDTAHPVIIVEYDPQWPVLYRKEKIRILETVGPKIFAIEHIGSTAVEGLGAKPIIDMMAGVHGLSDADECPPQLKKIGYIDITPQPDNLEWYYCLGRGPHSPGYHLHLVKFESTHWRKHLLFRDFLQTHPEVAQEYYELKKRLASEYRYDRVGYTNAKTLFTESVTSHIS